MTAMTRLGSQFFRDMPNSRLYASALGVYSVFFVVFFSPALIRKQVLGSGDGLYFSVPALTGGWHIWSDMIFSGFPAFADPQMLLWHPFRFLSFDYNAFLISAYVAASLFMFILVYEITEHATAAFASGFIYGLSGFMIGHSGHAAFVHGAAWVPIVLWSVLRLSKSIRASTWVAGVAAVACLHLAGHPQIVVYALTAAGLYGLFLAAHDISTNRERLFYLSVLLGMVAVGTAATSMQLLPFLELQALSLRTENTFEVFTSFNFPFAIWPIFFFPMIFGHTPPFNVAYFGHLFGAIDFAGTMIYAGVSSILLTIVAFVDRGRRAHCLFWLLLAAFTFVFILGSDTSFARWAFEVPVINRFRGPQRARFLIDVALAITTGVGIASVARGELRGRALLICTGVFLATLGAATILAWLRFPMLQSAAKQVAVVLPDFFSYQPVVLPILFGLLAVPAMFMLARRSSFIYPLALVALIVVDLGHNAWFAYWRTSAFEPGVAAMRRPWSLVQSELRLGDERFLALEGAVTAPNPVAGNLVTLHDVRSAGGYDPIALKSYFEAVGITPDGVYLYNPNSPALGMANVRWIDAGLMRYSPAVYGRCGPGQRDSVRIKLPSAVPSTRLRIVSRLSCGWSVAQDQPVATLVVAGPFNPGHAEEISIRAGVDTAEEAADDPAVRHALRHRPAPIHETIGAPATPRHSYGVTRSLNGTRAAEPIPVDSITLSFPSDASSRFEIVSLALENEVTGQSYPISRATVLFGDEKLWDRPVPTPQGGMLIRNLRPLSFAWLVGETRAEVPGATSGALLEGFLPDGSKFDLRKLAFVGSGPVLNAPPGGFETSPSAVRVLERRAGHLVFEVESPSDALLVVSQTDYPGWGARVNGRRAPVIRTNVAFQGVRVGPGVSRVELAFKSASLRTGLIISLLALAVCLGTLLVAHLRRLRRDRLTIA